jgi:hypothetical protein
MVVNIIARFVPTAVTATMMTTAISAAMSPYSIAVTPFSDWSENQSLIFLLKLRIPLPLRVYYNRNIPFKKDPIELC